MDSSSVVSYDNDITLQNTVKQDISVHELALHAMRDRCLLLQRRINTLESDNMRLKLDKTKSTLGKSYMPLEEDEKIELHQKIAELKKQKSQLLHHVFMVSCENRNLWNKISTIKKPDKHLKELPKQPLIRTNTYIQSTPKSSSNYQEKFSESNLEEISLKLINSYIQEKSQLVEQYEQMTQLQDDNDDVLNFESIGFTYFDDQPTDSLKEIHIHTEKLRDMKKELVQQEQDLKFIISKMEQVINEGYKCPSCLANNTKVTSSEHKEIETSDSLANFATPVDSTSYNNNFSEINITGFKKEVVDTDIKGEPTDKVCPMCGQHFPKEAEFSQFLTHVEGHFIGEPEPDSIMGNYDNISSSVDHLI